MEKLDREKEIRAMYKTITEKLIEKNQSITTMESCTSGQIASLITDTEGASAVLKGAFVTYCNEAKQAQGVDAEVIAQYGVYSAQTAAAMAKGCKALYQSDIGIGITGTFGNVDPREPNSVLGKVYFAILHGQELHTYERSLQKQESRYRYKLEAAALVAQELMTML